jgi:hypothetical protein
MFVAYRTVVGSIEFVVNLRDYHDRIDIEIGPVNVVPTPGSVSTTVSKSDTLEKFLDHYAKFILKAVSDITNSINHLECELLAPEIVRPEACEKCAYWGNPTDTADKRVCRYWDIPERECFTGRHEHCSQGYVNKTDVIDVMDIETPVLKKTYVTTSPDPRHSYFNRYLTELHGPTLPENIFSTINPVRSAWESLLPKLLDKPEEK